MFPGLLDCSSDDSEENAEDATDEEETVWFKEHLILVTPHSLIPIQNVRCSWDYRLITKQIEVLKSNDRKYKQSKRRNMFGKSVLHKQTLNKEF